MAPGKPIANDWEGAGIQRTIGTIGTTKEDAIALLMTITQKIVATIQSNDDLKVNFKGLADNIKGLTAGICESVPADQNQGWPGQALNNVIEELVLKLEPILDFVEEQATKSKIGEFLCDPSAFQEFLGYHEDVTAAMSQFERVTKTARVAEEQARAFQRLQEGENAESFHYGKARQGFNEAAIAQKNDRRRQDGKARTKSKAQERSQNNIAEQLQLLRERRTARFERDPMLSPLPNLPVNARERKSWVEEEDDDGTVVSLSEPGSEGQESGKESNEELEEESDSEPSADRADSGAQATGNRARQESGGVPGAMGMPPGSNVNRFTDVEIEEKVVIRNIIGPGSGAGRQSTPRAMGSNVNEFLRGKIAGKLTIDNATMGATIPPQQGQKKQRKQPHRVQRPSEV